MSYEGAVNYKKFNEQNYGRDCTCFTKGKGTILYNAAPNFSHVAVIPFPFFSNPTFHNLSNVYKPIDYCILQKCEKISNLEKTAKNAVGRPQIITTESYKDYMRAEGNI